MMHDGMIMRIICVRHCSHVALCCLSMLKNTNMPYLCRRKAAAKYSDDLSVATYVRLQHVDVIHQAL